MSRFALLQVALIVLACGTGSATTIFGVCGTGFTSASCATEAADGATDFNWVLMSAPSGGGGPAALITDEGSFPFSGSSCSPNCWVADDTLSKWISPLAAETSSTNNPTGNYTYEETFSMNGLNPATAVITGAWATDNSGTLELNGHVVATLPATGSFISLTSFSIPSADFTTGTNTLEVIVNNASSVTGLRVEITSATASALPEPSTFGAIGLGLVAFVARLRRYIR